MAINIRGIRIDSVTITAKEEEGDFVTGNYSLMSNNDKVLAKQSFNGYSDIKVALSAETIKVQNAFRAGVKKDIETVLGLIEEKG